jgi:transposase
VSEHFLPCERDQQYLMPVSLREWLPEDHLAWFVIDAVDQMELEAVYAAYRSDGWGAAAHEPKMMVGLLLYAYCLGIRSSRQIERACHLDVAFRVVTANQAPDHTTIARFRQRHAQALQAVFSGSLRLCAQAGMAGVGVVALDGTKLGCPASLQANHRKARIDAALEAMSAAGTHEDRAQDPIDAAVERMFAEAEAIDAEEDARFGTDQRGDEPPAQLRGRAARRQRFAQAKAELEAQEVATRAAHEAHLAERAAREQQRGKKLPGRKPKEPVASGELRANTSDPESRVMKTRGGYLQGFNAQAVVNADQVVVAAEVTDEQNDTAQLHPMIQALRDSLTAAGIDERPGQLLADAGYCSEENLAALTDDDPDCFIATRNLRKHPEPRNGRRGPLRANATLVDRMDRKVSTVAGRAIYQQRQCLVEPVFGQTKNARGARRFMRRGKCAASSEWKLLMGTHNLLKLYRRALENLALARWWRVATAATGA